MSEKRKRIQIPPIASSSEVLEMIVWLRHIRGLAGKKPVSTTQLINDRIREEYTREVQKLENAKNVNR